MTPLRLLLPVGLLLALACGGGDEPTAEPTPEPPPAGDVPGIVSEPLDGYAYLPGPDGRPESARFSRFSSSDKVYVGVDDANLRDAEGNVIDRLRLGTELYIVEAVSEPTVAIDRLNVWYTVTATGSGSQGRLFGGLLTPFGGREHLGEDGERGWAVTFAPDGRPRLRIDKTPGSDEAVTLDLNPSDRFVGGRLEASPRSWGDFEMRLDVMQCRLDGGEAPECSTATARLGSDGQSLEQITPPDPWQYAEPWSKPSCESGKAVGVTPAETTGPVVLSLEVPIYVRGPEPRVSCYDVGTVSTGSHQGKTVVSCAQAYHQKSGEVEALVARYLRDDSGWVELPCVSTMNDGATIQSRLVEDRIRVTVDASIGRLDGLTPPSALHLSGHTFPFSHHAPNSDRSTLTPAFEDPAVGQVYVGEDSLVIPLPDTTELRYDWKPTLSWSGAPPAEVDYSTQTMGCDGVPERLINIEPGVSAADLETVTTLTDGTPIRRLRSLDHPVAQRLLSEYDALKPFESYQRPPGFEADISREALLAKNPWLFIETPWGQHVLLTRSDLTSPAWCEPILYAYADPPAEISIAPRAPLSFFKTIPHAPDGWQGIAQPDGSVVVDGRRWSELFWEGRSGWFALPEAGMVVAEDDIEDYLTAALHAQGLRGREVDGFLAAWLPDLAGQGAMWIGFHTPEDIERYGPLDITPAPDTLIRVLMDAAPAEDAPGWDGTLPDFAPVPERAGVVVVEWGGMTRQ